MSNPLVGLARTAGHVAMAPMEGALRRKASGHEPAAPPIFLIGPPRSGTTLFYEAMIARFRLAYISNAAHRFYQTPLSATRLARHAIRERTPGFASSMGHIDGWAAPNEGGWNWRRWLPDGDWSAEGNAAVSDVQGLRNLTNGLAMVLDAPFLNKNVMHSNRLARMRQVWPDARFITVQRDIRANARSIIRAERKHTGPTLDADNWWSVRPSLTPEWIGRGDVERAVAQTVGTLADIARDKPSLKPELFMTVRYEGFCSEPQSTMEEVDRFLVQTGGAPEARLALPERFELSAAKPLSDDDEHRMHAALAELARGLPEEQAVVAGETV